MSMNKVITAFFVALLCLLLYFTHPFTTQLKIIALSVIAGGVLALGLAIYAKKPIIKDLLRDIGIAFIVAVVVTVIYEYSTRNLEKHASMLRAIDEAMAEFLPPRAWEDVKQEVLRRHRMRRNVEIEFKISRKARLSTGKYIEAPPGHVILWMKYGYDLYAIAPGGASDRVQHELGYEMWNPELEIPRFEKVTLIRDNQKEDLWEGERLKRITKDWSIILAPEIVNLPAPQLHKPVRIVSERYELMCAPGSYNLVMPELTVGDGPNVPTIKVTVTELPPDLEIRLDTFYAEHKFDPAGTTENSWVYTNLVLPGQGFSLIVQPRPVASMGAAPPMNH